MKPIYPPPLYKTVRIMLINFRFPVVISFCISSKDRPQTASGGKVGIIFLTAMEIPAKMQEESEKDSDLYAKCSILATSVAGPVSRTSVKSGAPEKSPGRHRGMKSTERRSFRAATS